MSLYKSFSTFSKSAHTKINLGLRIIRRRPDGYHELDTVFQQLEWGDTLVFSPSETFQFQMSGLAIDDGGNNLCTQAVECIASQVGEMPPLKLELQKAVPTGSGLGGGSADAAAVLKGVNQLLNEPLTEKTMETMALSLGADVPFFLKGGLQHGGGVGEKLKPLRADFGGVILLVIPTVHISTKQAFEALKIPLTAHRSPFTFGRLLEKATLVRFFENEFESVVFHMHPEIGILKRTLLNQGAFYASLSGSGSTVYGYFEDEAQARAAQAVFKNRYHTQITHPIN